MKKECVLCGDGHISMTCRVVWEKGLVLFVDFGKFYKQEQDETLSYANKEVEGP